VLIDPVVALMVEVKRLQSADLARFTEQFSVYCSEMITTPVASPKLPPPITALPVCRSPKGVCRYGGCADAGQCLAQPVAA